MKNEILYFGYNPSCENFRLPDQISDTAQKESLSGSSEKLIQAGKEALRRSVANELESVPSDTDHIVPLSSGLDSRIILSLLLERSEIQNDQIQTVSFGTRGTWDFEIGQQVAKKAGVSNRALDLNSSDFDWSVDSIRNYANDLDTPARIFEGYVNSKIVEPFADDSVVWSGFMGDPTVGGHYPAKPSENWRDAVQYFIQFNEFTPQLCPDEFSPEAILPDESFISQNFLTFEEQLDFAVRQQCFIRPLVIPEPERYCTPFMQEEWLSFALNLPPEHRRNRRLFKSLVLDLDPELFSIATDANRGLPLNAGNIAQYIQRVRLLTKRKLPEQLGGNSVSPHTNYLNFASAFREDGELKDTAKELISEFEKREVANWFSPRKIWEEHQNESDRSKEIRAICLAELVSSESCGNF